jgi:DNA-binding winged helix-turn-helix (wHTH) protein
LRSRRNQKIIKERSIEPGETVAAFAFGSFVLDVSERRVTHAGQPLALSGKTFDVLRLLVEARGRLVGRETFAARLWAGAAVEERNLTVHVSTVRKVLMRADASVDPIETVARTGYRLMLPVHDVDPAVAQDGRPLSKMDSLLREGHELLDREERLPALRALSVFERAVALDPDCAPAHAGLAASYLLLCATRLGRPLWLVDALQPARASAEKALALDSRQAEAWAVLGQLKMYYDWNWAGADADLAQAVTVGPRSADAHEARGWFLSLVGRHREAVETFAIANELAPRRRRTWELTGFARWLAGDDAGGIVALKTASALDPRPGGRARA